MMRRILLSLLTLTVATSAASGANILFNTVPFTGSTAPTTPGRQIVGGEPFVTFDPANDVLQFDQSAFSAVSTPLVFANGTAASLSNGVNVIVLQEFPASFNAGLAANAIAGQLTAPGAGFFIYFNTSLDLARLVYSADLDDPTADLQVLARFTNLSGQGGKDAFANITSGNFQVVPEPSSLLMTGLAGGVLLALLRRRG